MWHKLIVMLVFLAASVCCGAQNKVVGDARATLVVTATPSDASIYVDGSLKGKGSWSGKLKAGKYTIKVARTGYVTSTKTVTLKKEETRRVPVSLTVVQQEKKTVSTQKEKEEDYRATLSVKSTMSAAAIYIDGVYKREGSWSGKLKAGTHTIKVSRTGYQSYTKTVTLAKKENYTIDFPPLQEIARNTTPVKSTQTTPTATATPSVRTYTANGVAFEMVRVEGGTFMMGANEGDTEAFDWEKPRHQVTLSSYWIGSTEVTQALWEAVMGSNPSESKGDNLPVENVSWEDCQTFIGKLNKLTGARFCLPTEAEWEYAARGGKQSRGYKYSGSDAIEEVAWYLDNSGSKTHPVGKKKANELGLYDMSGNVYEWCADWFNGYSSSAQTNPTGPSEAVYHVLRGGSCYSTWGCHVYSRYIFTPVSMDDFLGLRLSIRE